MELHENSSWIVLPPGDRAIYRTAADHIPNGCRLATPTELLAANLGYPFPWGYSPDSSNASEVWKEYRIGVGLLKYSRWFITEGGRRFGGAANVRDTLPDSLRYCMYLDGGGRENPDILEENEGYAIVRPTDRQTAYFYRVAQLHAAAHVTADRGAVLVSPINEEGLAFVGFGGRCQICPNMALISKGALELSVMGQVPGLQRTQLYPELQNWRL